MTRDDPYLSALWGRLYASRGALERAEKVEAMHRAAAVAKGRRYHGQERKLDKLRQQIRRLEAEIEKQK